MPVGGPLVVADVSFEVRNYSAKISACLGGPQKKTKEDSHFLNCYKVITTMVIRPLDDHT